MYLCTNLENFLWAITINRFTGIGKLILKTHCYKPHGEFMVNLGGSLVVIRVSLGYFF
jgi:hypothetical protein